MSVNACRRVMPGNMQCPHCGSDTTAPRNICTVCGERIAESAKAGHLSDDRSATQSVALADITLESRAGRPSADGTPIGSLTVGQSLGRRYHVIKLLGVGGMGAVYQCWDEELGMPIALKVIRPEIVADSEPPSTSNVASSANSRSHGKSLTRTSCAFTIWVRSMASST